MQFDDPKRVLESAAASPSRPVDPQALVRRGTKLRRARYSAAVAGLALVVGGASASFGLLGSGREGGPDPAGAVDCSDEDLTASVYLHDYASETAVAAFERELRAIPDVVAVERVSEEEALGELEATSVMAKDGMPARLPRTVPASLRVRVANARALEEVFRTRFPVVQGVAPGGRLACVVQNVCEGTEPPKVSIFLRDDASPSEVRWLRRELRTHENVTALEYVSKADAYREFKELYAGEPELWETVPPNALPASFRVETANVPAVELLARGASRAVDEVIHDGEIFHRLCSSTPPPEPTRVNEPRRPVPPPVLGRSFGEHVNDVLITMDRAECDSTPSWDGAPAPEPRRRWCRFEVSIRNLSDETFRFELPYQQLQTTSHVYRPDPSESRFREAVAPGETGGGWLVFRPHRAQDLEFLGVTAPGYGSASGRPGAFSCRATFAAESGVCSYSYDRALLRFRYVQEVELYHCGVEPFTFSGRRWVSDPPPFDATNAPADFTGTGTIELVTETEAIFVDSSGAEIELRADEDWEPPPCA